MNFQINYMAIVVAAVINMAVGTMWFGPLFGKMWMKSIGISKSDMKGVSSAFMAKIYVAAFVGAFVMAYVLAHFVQLGGNTTAVDGAMVGFWLWVGFVATTTLGGVLWERKPINWYVLTASYYLVVLVINGALLATWK